MSSLKDLYENPDLEENSEEDSDFIPEDNNESDDQEDLEESEEETEVSTSEQDKKSKIDAIWAEMNQPSDKKQKVEIITQKEEKVVTEEPPKNKRKLNTTTATVNKRPKSNLNSLMNKYKIKEPKLNTLEKSKLDWQGFVKKEGIEDELKYKNKDGYMEKVAFLNRVDDRRLNQLKQGQKKKDA